MQNKKYLETLFYFLKLRTLGFGGPLALISSMHRDLVLDKKWLDELEFQSAFSLIKAMPGPLAFMLAVFIGRKRANYWGGFLAAFGLIFPPAVIMIIFSMSLTSLNHFQKFPIWLMGMQLTSLGVILGSVKGLVRNQIKNIVFWFLVFVSGTINYFHPSVEPIIIISMGLIIVFSKKMELSKRWDLAILFLVMFKAGALVFGSGLAIVPMLKHDVVTKYQWLSESEFLTALSFGQMSPGPVVITSTYIGHQLHGILGAIVATIGIFLASFFHMMTWFPIVLKKLEGNKSIQDFIFGAIAAVVGPILVTVLKLYINIQHYQYALIFFVVSFLITIWGKVPLWFLIPFGGVVYLLF